MKSSGKSKIIILITLGILFALLPIITTNLSFITGNSIKSSDNKNLKISTVSGKIHIIGNSGWVDFKNAGNCTGNGIYSEPYVIEDLVIDGGGSGNGIWIENSDVYFKIENCTVYNSGETSYGGITLSHVNNSQLIDNTVHNNAYGIFLLVCDNNTISGNSANDNDVGIHLLVCNNNTISGNTINDNKNYGIHLLVGDNNTISENTVNNNQWHGIYMSSSNNNNIYGNTANNNGYDGIRFISNKNNMFSGNIMNDCGFRIYGTIETLASNYIDTTNLVNGKPLYYYNNETDLNPNNFTNAGQVILSNCNYSTISDLDVSHGSIGISLFYSNNMTISNNNASHNNWYGVYLYNSINNTILGNKANYNGFWGINIHFSDNNIISGNTANYNRDFGIYLGGSNNNEISGNTVNYNSYGMFLVNSDYNTISGNTLLENHKCIYEEDCEDNIFENNDCGIEPAISGYNLFFLLGILSVVVIILSKKIKKS